MPKKMKPFTLKNLTETQLQEKSNRLLADGANLWFSQSKNNKNQTVYNLSWFFGNNLDLPAISVSKFNRFIKKEGYIKSLKEDYGKTELINEHIASLFVQFIVRELSSNPSEVDFKNRSKNPRNHFQMETYFGTIYLDSLFIYVDNEHKVVGKYTNVYLSNSESYEQLCEIKFIDQ